MQDSSSTATRDVLPVQLDARPAQAPQSVPHAFKMDSQSSREPVKPFVVMDSLPELNNAMIKIPSVTMDAQLPAPFKPYGLVLANHLSVPTTAQLFAETAESKGEKNVMMEISSTETVAQTNVLRKPQPQATETLNKLKRD